MIRRLADSLLAVVLAPVCAACRCPLDSPTSGAVCDACWQAIPFFDLPCCRVCGDPLISAKSSQSDDRCPRCQTARTAITSAAALGAYKGSLRAIVHALKYERRRSIASGLSTLMRIRARSVLMGAGCAVPVPLHWRRRWLRGFNQAAALAAGLELSVVHALKRTRATRTQTDLPADERHANVHGAFAVRRRSSIVGACVVLVDDVSTTGATLEACAQVLIAAGAREVRAVTAARVVTRQPSPHRR